MEEHLIENNVQTRRPVAAWPPTVMNAPWSQQRSPMPNDVPFQNLNSVTVVKGSASTLAGTSLSPLHLLSQCSSIPPQAAARKPRQRELSRSGISTTLPDWTGQEQSSERPGFRSWREHAPCESEGDEVNGWGVRRQ
jgi:hypothetical protein